MYMPLIAKEDGIVQLIKQPGATLEAGDITELRRIVFLLQEAGLAVNAETGGSSLLLPVDVVTAARLHLRRRALQVHRHSCQLGQLPPLHQRLQVLSRCYLTLS
jgi:hypothetical protein